MTAIVLSVVLPCSVGIAQHLPADVAPPPPGASESAIFAPPPVERIPREPDWPSPIGPIPDAWSGETSGGGYGYLQGLAMDSVPARMRYRDWQYMAWSMRLSDLQWHASLARFPVFRADAARTADWTEGLDLRADPAVIEDLDEHPRFARASVAYVQSIARETATFFHWVDDEILTDGQRSTSDACRRAAERRIRLTGTPIRYAGADADPDCALLLEIGARSSLPAIDLEMLHAVLQPWRAEADAMAAGMLRSCRDFLSVADGSWTRLGTKDLTVDDFRAHQAAADKHFALQTRWLEHCRAYPDLVRPVVGEAVADELVRFLESARCPILPIVGTGFLSPLTNAAGGLGPEQADARQLLLAELDDLGSALAPHVEALCARERDRRVLEYRFFPLWGRIIRREANAMLDDAASWEAIAREGLEQLERRVEGLGPGLEPDQARRLESALERARERLAEQVEAWTDFAETYLPFR